MTFDKKLKALRIENGMTQKAVAKQLNVARSTIAGYETKNRQPSHEKLTAIAELFHVSVDYLISDNDQIEVTPSKYIIESKEEADLIKYYRSLSSKSKRDLFSHCNLLQLRDQKELHQK